MASGRAGGEAQPFWQQHDYDRAQHRSEEGPEPPAITISSIASEVEMLNGAGSTNCTRGAKQTPATPA